MTELFVLMWLGDITSAVSVASAILLMATTVLGGVLAIISLAESDSSTLKPLIRWCKYVVPLIILGGMTPSKSTVQLLAATQAVKLAADTNLGQKGITAIEAVLDKVIADSKK